MRMLMLTAALSLISGFAGAKTIQTLDREVFVREPYRVEVTGALKAGDYNDIVVQVMNT